MKKSILIYIGIIMVVSLAIVIILRAGSHLEAPASLGGQWQIQAPEAGLEGCQGLPPALPASVLTIQQSGRMLQLHFASQPAHEAFAGRLTGLQFEAITKGNHPLIMHGSLDRQTQPHTLTATLSTPDCPAPITFVGVRQSRALAGSGGH